MGPKGVVGMANSVDPDQTALILDFLYQCRVKTSVNMSMVNVHFLGDFVF